MNSALIISVIAVVIAFCGLLVTMLVNARKEGKQSGKIEVTVTGFTTALAAFATKLQALEQDRATLLALSDERIASALARNNEATAQRDHDVLDAVRGFKLIVDDLKAEWSAVRNMMVGERRLVELVAELRLELARLQAEYRNEHPPHTSQPVHVSHAVVIQEGAPSDDWGDEGNNR